MDHLLIQYLDVYRRTYVADVYGSLTSTYTLYFPAVKCRFYQQSMTTNIGATDRNQPAENAVFFLREIAIRKDDKILYDNQYYRILGINKLYDLDDLNHLEISVAVEND